MRKSKETEAHRAVAHGDFFAPRPVFPLSTRLFGAAVLVGLFISLLLIWGLPAAGAEKSAPTAGVSCDAVTKALTRTFGEARRAVALVTGGSMIEIWGTNKGAKWTIIHRRADGTCRMIGHGTNWETILYFPAPVV